VWLVITSVMQLVTLRAVQSQYDLCGELKHCETVEVRTDEQQKNTFQFSLDFFAGGQFEPFEHSEK
jgi:hypothetical protein